MDWLFVDYWPWWLCAAFFATLVVTIWLVERRLLGVSGSYAAAVERTRAQDEALRTLDEAAPEAIEDALMRATLEEFGPEAVEAYRAEMAKEASAASAVEPAVARSPLSRSVHLTFLAMVAVGGAIGALASGTLEPRFDLGPLHEALTGGGATSVAMLVIGGFLVGLGTRMAGGCTSGHGLSGCARLQPASLIATACFFGAGIAVSFLLEAVAT